MAFKLSMSTPKDFDSATGIFPIYYLTTFNTEIPLDNGTLTVYPNPLYSNVLLQGTIPLSIVAYTDLNFATPIAPITPSYFVPLLGYTLYPIDITLKIYKNSHTPSNLIYTLPHSLNDPINPLIKSIANPAPTTLSALNTYLLEIEDITTRNDTLAFEYVDILDNFSTSACCQSLYSDEYTPVANPVNYLFYIEVSYSRQTLPTLDTNFGPPTNLQDILDLITNINNTLGPSYESEISLTLSGNYVISALEVSK